MKNSHIVNALYIVLGCIMTVIAIIGVYTPGLPSTEFVIVALWAFSKSSPRLHAWLSNLPILKQAIEQAESYQKHRAISKKVKMIAQICAWSSFTLLLVTNISLVSTIAVFLAAAACSVFMYKVKTLEIE